MRKESKGEIIIAPRYAKVIGPVIFLAGPIQGAADWQSRAIQLIQNKNPELNIASPRRAVFFGKSFTEADWNEQVDWEHYYLQRASENGVILFWLAKEAEHRCDRAYAQITRFELGEAVVLQKLAKIKVVVGVEEDFTGGRYVRKTLRKKYPDIPLCDTLEATCETAVQLAIKK